MRLKEKSWSIEKVLTQEKQIKEQIKEIDKFLNPEADEQKRKEKEQKEEEKRKEMEEEEDIKQAIELRMKKIETEMKKKLKKAEPEKSSDVVFRPLPQKSSLFEKVWARAISIILLLTLISCIAGFWYWYIVIKKKNVEFFPSPYSNEEQNFNLKEIKIPLSLVPVQEAEIIDIVNLKEIPDNFYKVLKKLLPEDNFTGILIKNQTDNKIIGLKEFLHGFNIKSPENFEQNIGKDWISFIYTQPEGKRIGFIVNTEQNQNLEEILKDWEVSMEQDFENIFKLMGKEKPAAMAYFNSLDYNGVNIRYQTFSTEDFGICYAVSDNYFIWTSSIESIKKLIDKLPESDK